MKIWFFWTALQQNDQKNSSSYRFKTKVGTYIYLKTLWKIFKNPWTREFEYMIGINENVAIPESDALKSCANQTLVETKIGHKVKSNSSIKGKSQDNALIPIQNELDIKADKQSPSQCSSHSSSDGLTPPSSGSSGENLNL